jgi:hypothetical protein
MATYAMMSGNTVDNIIVADNKEATEESLRCILIEITAERPASIGWTYDEQTNQFNPPEELETV